jgi:hypothetical protein
MKYPARFAIVLLTASLTAGGPYAHAAGPGSGGQGGHGGFGGHGGGHSASGGHGGHAGRGGFSSAGAGHTVGHSLGRIFGLHGKGPARGVEAPDTGPAVTFGAVVQPAGPKFFVTASRRFHHRHGNDFPFGGRSPRFRHGRRFGFDDCGGFASPRHRFFFGDDFNCFGAGFFFDLFFLAGFSNDFVQGDVAPDREAETQAAQFVDDADLAAAGTAAEENVGTFLAQPEQPQQQQPITLMQLRDGSMYGLTDYWLEGAQLHYKTTYGGENSIALDRVDLQKTARLNSERGMVFVPEAKNP